MVGLNGLEPSTSRLSGVRSNQLSYRPIYFTGAVGIEPTLEVLETSVLPLNYAPKWCRLEDLNPQPTDYKSVALPIELSRHKKKTKKWWLGTESNRRHEDFQSSALPTELPSQHKMAVPTGVEPAISCVTGRHVNHYTTGPLVAGTGFEPATFGL